MYKFFSTKILSVYHWSLHPTRDKKVAIYLQLAHNANLSFKKRRSSLFLRTFQPFYDPTPKETEKLNFVQGVYFESIYSLKNSDTDYMLHFDDSCEQIWISKVFVQIATAGRHREYYLH